MAHLKEYRQATELTSLFLFCVFLMVPILGPYAKSIGLSDFQVSLVFAVFPLTLIFASSTFCTLSDSVGRKKVIIFGIIAEIIGILLYLGGTWYTMLLGRLLEAVAFACVVFVGLASVQDHVAKKSRGKYSGFALSLMQLGKVIAPLLGGLIADYWFVKGPFVFSSFALLIMLWIVALHDDMKLNHKFTRSDFNLMEKLKAFLSYRRLKGMAVLGVVMHASLPITFVFIPIYITEHFGLSYKFVGIALFATEFFMLFQFAVGYLCDRFSKAKLTLAGVVILGSSLMLLSLAPSYNMFLVVLLLYGIGAALWNVSAWAFMSDIGEGMHREGFVIGSYTSIAKIGSLASFLIGGWIVHKFGVSRLMLVVGILIICGAFIASFFMLGKTRSRRKSI